MASDMTGEQMQAKITAARREAEGLKDKIKRRKDELADTSRTTSPSHPMPILLVHLDFTSPPSSLPPPELNSGIFGWIMLSKKKEKGNKNKEIPSESTMLTAHLQCVKSRKTRPKPFPELA